MFILSVVAIVWKMDDGVEKALVTVPLRYNDETSINLTLPVVFANRNGTKTPIVFMGPGNGAGNVDDQG